MNIFRYKAYDYKGRIYSGTIFALTEQETIDFLLKQNLTPIEVKQLSQSLLYRLIFKFLFRISFKQKIFLFRNLYLILKSGLTLDKGLRFLIQESKGSLRDFLFYVNYSLQKGQPFYKAFTNFPQIFSQVEIETIKAGEISGNLVKNLEKLIESLEKQREIRNEIISNLIYPAIVLALSFGVIVLLITFVLPKVSVLLTQLTEKPPLLTKILIVVSDFVNAHLSFITFLFIFLFLSLIFVLSLKKTRNFLFLIFIKLPFISKIYLNLSLSRSLFILRSLLSAGLHLTDSIRLAGQATFHPDLRNAFLNSEKELKQGKQIKEALGKQEIIPKLLVDILAVAGEAGYLEEALKTMEGFYLEEFRNSVRNILNLLQPALLIFVGVVVGFVAIAVLVPIYQQISQQLQFEGRNQAPGSLK